jgi:hypothetical protein
MGQQLHVTEQESEGMDEMTLIADYDEEIGLYYFVVKEGDAIVHFRPDFRTREEAERGGDLWIRQQLGATPRQDIEDD